MKKLLTLASLTMLLFLQVGCGDIKITPYDSINYSESASQIQFCTTPADTIRSNLKFIFVIDRSGSNQHRTGATGSNPPTAPGTDPDGSKRFDAILNFVANFQDDPYVFWAEINFNDDATVAQHFTNDRTAFLNFTQDQKNRTAGIDQNGTNYLSALDALNQLITTDVHDAANADPVVSSNYVIFFMSDGAPLVHGVTQGTNDILAAVSAISALQQQQRDLIEGITFNTAYYTADVPPGFIPRDNDDPRGLLQQMADTGSGEFLDVGNGAAIDLSRFVVPVRISRFALKEIWVANENNVWWGNRLMLDTDADGLPDEVERQLGSDPLKYDTDGDGVGDGVYYRVSGQVCQFAGCTPANVPTSCLGSHPSGGAGHVTFPDTDGDYLNDCEEKLLGTNYKNPDSNGDYLPDWMAFANQVQTVGLSDLYTDADSDGVNNYQEIKQNTPVLTSNSQVAGLVKLQYQGQMVSSDARQDCFVYSLQNLAFHTSDDKIRLFIFENRRSMNDKVIVRTAEKQVNPYGLVHIDESDLKRIE